MFKAIALGAKAVLLGRPYAYGLAVGGEQGVSDVLANLIADMDLTLGLAGWRVVSGGRPGVPQWVKHLTLLSYHGTPTCSIRQDRRCDRLAAAQPKYLGCFINRGRFRHFGSVNWFEPERAQPIRLDFAFGLTFKGTQ